MPSDGWVSNREVEAAWSCTLLQPASLRATSCVSFAKFASDRAYLGKERIKVCLIGDLDGGLGVAAEAQVDASPIGFAGHCVPELN